MPFPSLNMPTRDPALSETSTPAALSMASISDHLMSEGVGLVKIRSRVRRCLALRYGTMLQYHQSSDEGTPLRFTSCTQRLSSQEKAR